MLRFATDACADHIVHTYDFKNDPFINGYMDDANIVAPYEQAMEGAREFASQSKQLGFTPASGPTKNKLWSPCPTVRQNLTPTHEVAETLTVHTLNAEGITILGAPIGPDAYVHTYMQSIVKAWKHRLEEIRKLPLTQVSMLLTRMCEVPRLVFYMRTVPSKQWNLEIVSARDMLYEHIMLLSKCPHNMPLSTYGKTLLSLPLRMGGAGITNPVDIADIAYVSSVLGCMKDLLTHSSLK